MLKRRGSAGHALRSPALSVKNTRNAHAQQYKGGRKRDQEEGESSPPNSAGEVDAHAHVRDSQQNEDEDAKFENEDLSGDDEEDDDDDDDDDTWSITTGRNIYTFPRKSVSKQREISRYQRMISHLQNENIQEEYLHAMFDSKVDAKCERSCHEI
uniref:Uncharacterized protein n=1 Tax=Timema cristinae TaxID=61476 RepID=A0A7R9H5H2_TIMCR|nr:unnamed protein product [Timema cristinae]